MRPSSNHLFSHFLNRPSDLRDLYLTFLKEEQLVQDQDSLADFLIRVNNKTDVSVSIHPKAKELFGDLLYAAVYSCMKKIQLKTNKCMEDVAGEFMESILTGKKKLNYRRQNNATFQGYIYCSLANFMNDFIRSESALKRHFCNPKNAVEITMEMEESMEYEDEPYLSIYMMRSLLITFHPKANTLLRYFDLIYVRELKINEVARLLGVTVNNVYYHQRKIISFFQTTVIRDRIALLSQN